MTKAEGAELTQHPTLDSGNMMESCSGGFYKGIVQFIWRNHDLASTLFLKSNAMQEERNKGKTKKNERERFDERKFCYYSLLESDTSPNIYNGNQIHKEWN